MLISAAVPVRLVTRIASTVLEVIPSSKFNTDAEIDESVIVIVVLLRLLIPVEAYAALIASAVPISAVTVPASTVPEVLPSSVFNTDAVIDVSLIVTASLPRPVIPVDKVSVLPSAYPL